MKCMHTYPDATFLGGFKKNVLKNLKLFANLRLENGSKIVGGKCMGWFGVPGLLQPFKTADLGPYYGNFQTGD